MTLFTTFESFGSTSLVEDGNNYFLKPNGGQAVELSYGGSPVVDGSLATLAIPGSRSARSKARPDTRWPGMVAGADEYTVWYTDASGNYLSSAFDIP
ncbi:MAG TPA: hypothetical protein VFE63_14080 [Roseiarcus sp.]|nr:hypothetical protein [Roseiarcus sp.]